MKTPLVLSALFLLGLIPSLRYAHTYETYTVLTTIIIVLSSVLLFLCLPKPQEKVLPLLLLWRYKKNIEITFQLLSNIIGRTDRKEDNEEERLLVHNILRQHFDFRPDFSAVDTSRPCIYISNYISDRIENIACVLVPGDTAIMMRTGLGILWKAAKWKIEVDAKNAFQSSKEAIEAHNKENRSVFCYAVHRKNGLRHDYVNTVRTGIFRIAKDLNIPVTFVAIDTIHTTFWGTIPNQKFQIKCFPTCYVKDVGMACYAARVFFRKTLRDFAREKFL